MSVQVWDAAMGSKQYTFEGHEAPVYSVLPHAKGNIPVCFCFRLHSDLKVLSKDLGRKCFPKEFKVRIPQYLFLFPSSSHNLLKIDSYHINGLHLSH